ncbi:MAG: hypothetical protein ACFFDT_37610, partial [Candidatus Hodarchaeota archaeon]
MLSPRGAFVAISGLLLISIGLACMGIKALADLFALLFMSFGGIALEDSGEDISDPLGLIEKVNDDNPANDPNLSADSIQLLEDLSWIQVFNIPMDLV